jgi:hypothetical protein
LIFLAFVVPLACYCLFLALLHRGRHPVLISGPWDFAGILFAVSGFVLLGGPAALTGIYERWRMSWLLGQTRFLLGVGEQWHFWVSLWMLYFTIVVVGAATLLWRRRGQTSIYNIEPATFDDVLSRVLDRLGMESFSRGPQRLLIHRRENQAGEDPVETSAYSRSASAGVTGLSGANDGPSGREGLAGGMFVHSPGPWMELDVEVFRAMRHVTLHWRGEDGSLRSDVETGLARALRETATRANPVGAWLLSLAVCLFFLSAFGLFAVLVLRILQLPR